MKKEVIIHIDKELSKEERKCFSKENLGKRLCLGLRYPNLPMYLSIISLVLSLLAALLMMQWI